MLMSPRGSTLVQHHTDLSELALYRAAFSQSRTSIRGEIMCSQRFVPGGAGRQTSEAVLASAADGEIDLERFDELTGARLQILQQRQRTDADGARPEELRVVGSVLRPPRPVLG
jgi:hypothetical protein